MHKFNVCQVLKNTKITNSFLFFMISIVLISCNVGPDYIRPSVKIPTTYKEASTQVWKEAIPQDTDDRGKWWLIFNDPILNELEEKATKANQSIAVAEAQYHQALAIVDSARANFFPIISAGVGKTRARSLSSTNTTLAPQVSQTASLDMQASWEIDLWGNVRRLVEADEAAAQASAAQLAAVRLSIQATVAQTYFQLRALDEAQTLFDKSVASYEKFLTLTNNQYKAGTASQIVLLQADAQLQTIKISAIDNGVARAQYEHALAVLVNEAPATFSIYKKTTLFAPPKIPVSVPSTLLEHRPDIAKAERLMAEANAEIGVATSAFFPVLSLGASGSLNKKSFAHLLSAPIALWSLGAQLTETIFDGGARLANIEAADAAYHATVATYRQTVLAAFQDVEDNLSTLRILQNEYEAQAQAVTIAQKQMKHTLDEYKSGTVSTLDVLNTLFNVYVEERNMIALLSRRMTTSVGLIKALG